MTRRLIAALLAVLALAGASCSPPQALRDLVGRKPPPGPAGALGPPAPPAPPVPLFFGVVVRTNSSSWGRVLARSDRPGALVIDVVAGTPAAGAGVGRGDVIVGVDGREIRNDEGLTVSFRSRPEPRRRVALVTPGGEERPLEVTLSQAGEFSLPEYVRARPPQDGDPIARYLLAQTTEDTQQAVSLLRALVEDRPEFAAAQALLARRMLDGLVERAPQSAPSAAEIEPVRRTIVRAVSLDPGSSDVQATAASILLTLGDYETAERHAARAASIDPTSAIAQHLLGRTRLERGDGQEALQPLRRAVALNPYNLDYYAFLARCYLALRQDGAARATIEAAKSLVDDPEIERGLDEVVRAPRG